MPVTRVRRANCPNVSAAPHFYGVKIMTEKTETKKPKKRIIKLGPTRKRAPRMRKPTAKDITPDISGADMLVPLEEYLKSGVHIGSQFKSGHMKRYIYKTRQDGLKIIDVKTIDERLGAVAEFLSRYDPSRILVIAERPYARKPAKKFAELIGAKAIIKRFIPGTLTNPTTEHYTEADVIFVSDPNVDKQALIESKEARIPVVALADTNNDLNDVDIVIPINNKGKKSLALAYWILAREILLKRGSIKSKSDFKETVDDFESVMKK